MTNKSVYAVGDESPMPNKMRKTERSHEENQERAYVAASRRADRSIEARVQSARMASEIHKKRTGKGFRISEDIVMKEEMYEEEEEFFPRSHRLLGPHMRTASPEMNLRMEAYLTNRMAMSAMVAGNNDSWRQNDIHTQFAQFFPNAGRQAHEMSRRMSGQMMPGQTQLEGNSPVRSPALPTFGLANDQQNRSASFSSTIPSAQDHSDETMSPVDSNPKTPVTDFTAADADRAANADSPMDLGAGQSAFTAELPPEAKMLMAGSGVDMNDPFAQSMYGQDWSNNGPYFNFSDESRGLKGDPLGVDMPDIYGDAGIPPAKLDQQQEINWGSFVNEDWDNDQ